MELEPDEFMTPKERDAMESVMKKLLEKAFYDLIKEHPKYRNILKKKKRK